MTAKEIKEAGERYELVVSDGEPIVKLVPPGYDVHKLRAQAKEKAMPRLESAQASKREQAGGQAKAHANTFGIVPKSLLEGE
jgi:antitoxin (DNA-binding transcriptional repressor) of toxin-antitoxin stability system